MAESAGAPFSLFLPRPFKKLVVGHPTFRRLQGLEFVSSGPFSILLMKRSMASLPRHSCAAPLEVRRETGDRSRGADVFKTIAGLNFRF